MATKPKPYTIEYFEQQIKHATMAISVLKRSDVVEADDLNVRVYKLYVQHKHTKVVTEILNETGFRYINAGKERKLQPTDISDIINSVEIEDKELMALAREMFLDSKKKATKAYG